MFHVGQKVVCVVTPDWVGQDNRKPTFGPALKEIVTIKEIIADDNEWLTLKEYPGTETHNYCYPALHFRPLVERKTDISIFKRMLVPQQESERV